MSEISETTFIPAEHNTYNLACSTSVELPKIKGKVKTVIANEYLQYFNEQVNSLTMQGDFIKLLVEEEEDVTWKSIIYSVPKGVMSFACRAATNSLATNDNLVRWGKKTNSQCNLNGCLHKGTLLHILNGCKIMLDQGRYTWRHDNILHYIAKLLSQNRKENIDFFVDIPNYNINGGTLPPNVIVTQQKPDIVIVDKNTTPHTVLLYELTCPFAINIMKANSYKKDKYSGLKQDIIDNGYTCHLIPFEICSRGFVPRRVKIILCSMLSSCSTVKTPSSHIKFISKLSLISSFSIFHSRKENQWSDPPTLEP